MKRRHQVGWAALIAVCLIALPAGIAGCGSKAAEDAAPEAGVPDVAGMTEQEAVSALVAARLSFEIEYLPGEAEMVGMVLSQENRLDEDSQQVVFLVIGTEAAAEVTGIPTVPAPAPAPSPSPEPEASTPSTWVTCSFCHGTGKVNGVTCSVCLGTGQVR
ncbi:MAG: hypothetical protein ACYC55_00285 [Candidatus Geothermincolia bacterium]